MAMAAMTVSASIGGSGTVDDPYTINSAEDLKELSDNVRGGESYEGKFLKLTNDIDLYGYSNEGWQPIGWSKSALKGIAFCGNFDGGGHVVSGLYFDQKKHSQVGLFGYVKFGVISNLTLKNCMVHGMENVGAVVGCMSDGATLKNVKV